MHLSLEMCLYNTDAYISNNVKTNQNYQTETLKEGKRTEKWKERRKENTSSKDCFSQ